MPALIVPHTLTAKGLRRDHVTSHNQPASETDGQTNNPVGINAHHNPVPTDVRAQANSSNNLPPSPFLIPAIPPL